MIKSSKEIRLAHVNLKIGIQYHKYMFKIKGAEVVKMYENSYSTETKKDQHVISTVTVNIFSLYYADTTQLK